MPVVPPEVDGTTPSLCSDNDNEAEDRAPSTPPLLPPRPEVSRITDRFVNRQITGAPASEVVSVEVQPPRERLLEPKIYNFPSQTLKQQQSIAPSAQLPTRERSLPSTSIGRQLTRPAEAVDDPFSRRPPSSPMLPETPRRPRPPGRVRSGSKPTTRTSARSRSPSAPGGADDDNPFSLAFAPPDESTPALDPVGKRHPARGQASRKQRRMTLDEEIRRVDPSYSDEERAVSNAEAQRRQSSYSDEERAVSKAEAQGRQSSYGDEERVVGKAEAQRQLSAYNNEEHVVDELESGLLIGVGRRSKRLGFLAHGGAGGEPVLMGVGYVEGAVAEEVVVEERMKGAEVGMGKRKTRSNAGGKRRPKR